MIKKSNKLSILIAVSLSFALVFMSSTITLGHIVFAQSNGNKSKETSQPIIGNISQGGKAIGAKAGQLAQSIVNETGKVFSNISNITGALNKPSTSGGK